MAHAAHDSRPVPLLPPGPTPGPRVAFRSAKGAEPTRCEIVDLRIGRLIQVTSTGQRGPRRYQARLTYELEDLGRRTKVTEQIEIADPGIPLIFRAIVWLISRFGRPTGETTLMRLKRLAEAERS